MDLDTWTKYAMEKLKQSLEMIGNMGVKSKELLSEMDLDTWTKYAVEKLKQSLEVIKNMGESLMKRVDEVFPPEERAEKIAMLVQVAKPYLKYGVALLLILLFFRYGRGGGGGAAKTMKAPGRNIRIPRDRFEKNPRAYFRGLRGKN